MEVWKGSYSRSTSGLKTIRARRQPPQCPEGFIARHHEGLFTALDLNCRRIVALSEKNVAIFSCRFRSGPSSGAKPETYELLEKRKKKVSIQRRKEGSNNFYFFSLHDNNKQPDHSSQSWLTVNGYRSPCFNAFGSHTRKGFRLPNYSRSGRSAPPHEFKMKPPRCRKRRRRSRSTKPQIPNSLRVLDWSGDL